MANSKGTAHLSGRPHRNPIDHAKVIKVPLWQSCKCQKTQIGESLLGPRKQNGPTSQGPCTSYSKGSRALHKPFLRKPIILNIKNAFEEFLTVCSDERSAAEVGHGRRRQLPQHVLDAVPDHVGVLVGPELVRTCGKQGAQGQCESGSQHSQELVNPLNPYLARMPASFRLRAPHLPIAAQYLHGCGMPQPQNKSLSPCSGKVTRFLAFACARFLTRSASAECRRISRRTSRDSQTLANAKPSTNTAPNFHHPRNQTCKISAYLARTLARASPLAPHPPSAAKCPPRSRRSFR